MSLSLVEALEQVNLEPWTSLFLRSQGLMVELRVLKSVDPKTAGVRRVGCDARTVGRVPQPAPGFVLPIGTILCLMFPRFRMTEQKHDLQPARSLRNSIVKSRAGLRDSFA